METHKMHNGHLVYSVNDPSKYHLCYEFRVDFESTWESVVYVADLAYDARDIVGLFFDGVTIAILNHYDVPVPVIGLIGGIILGVVVLKRQHKQKKE